MGLQIKRPVGNKLNLIASFVAIFALVMQPMYGLVAERIAKALPVNTPVTQLDSHGWAASDVRGTGKVAISKDKTDRGGGSASLNLALSSSSDKAGFIKTANYGPVNSLSALSYDWYRDSASTAAGHFAPALNLDVDDGAGNSWLLHWEAGYDTYPTNGPAVPTDTWVTSDILNGKFWRSPLRVNGAWVGYGGCSLANDPHGCFVYDRKLSDAWLNGFSVGAIEVNAGSGWNGTFNSYVDNVRINSSTFDFQAAPQPVKNTSTQEEFDTIQAAINDTDTTTGDVITVSPGVYNESVTINKSVTILGAQSGNDARTRNTVATGETIVNSGTQTAFTISAKDVKIDGFTIAQTGGSAHTINTSNVFSGVSIANNIFSQTSTGSAMHLYGGQDFEVSQNLLKNVPGQGIIMRNGNLTNATDGKIQNNRILNHRGTAGGAISVYGQTDLTISSNYISTAFQGISVGADGEDHYKMKNIQVTDNDIDLALDGTQSGVNFFGILVRGNGENTLIKNNTVEQTGTLVAGASSYGLVRVSYDDVPTAAANPTNLVITENNLLSNMTDRYVVIGKNVTSTLNFANNWWGTKANPSSKVTSTNATVKSSPWLCGPWEGSPASTTDGSCDNSAPTEVKAESALDGKRVQTPNHNITFSAKDDAGLKRFDVTVWKKNDNRSDANTIIGSWGAVIDASEKTSATRTVNIVDILRSNHKNLAEGEYIIYFTSTDLANKSTNGNSVTFTIDKTPPAAPKNLAVRVTSNGAYIPNNGYTNQKNVTAYWANGSNEDVTYVYKYWKTEGSVWTENNKWPNPTSSTSYAGSYNQDEGVHKFCVVAIDRAGNESACSATYTVTYDTTAPTAEIIVPANNSTVRGTVDITGKMTDDVLAGNHWFEIKGNNYSYTTGAGVDNDSDTYTMSWDTSILEDDGTYTIRYVAKDKAGNRSDVNGATIHTVTVDNTAPDVRITNTSSTDSTITLTGTTDEPNRDITVVFGTITRTVTPNIDGNWSVTFTGLDPNTTYTYTVSSSDAVGNQFTSGQLSNTTFATTPVIIAPSGDEPEKLPEQNTEEAPTQIFALGTGASPFDGPTTGMDTDTNTDPSEDVLKDSVVDNPEPKVLGTEDAKDNWSLANLLLSVVVWATTLMALAGLFGKEREERNTLFRVLTLVPAVGAAAIIYFVENFNANMGWVDIWTIPLIVLAVIQVALLSKARSGVSE